MLTVYNQIKKVRTLYNVLMYLEMKFVSLVILLHLLITVCCRHKHMSKIRRTRIIGGRITSIIQFPFIGSLIVKSKRNGEFFGGGTSIISPHWAITAAHCVSEFQEEIKNNDVFVRSNSSSWSMDRALDISEHQVLRGIIHEKYNWTTDDFDVAVLEIESEFVGVNERPISLAAENYEFKAGTSATVLGWGTTIAKSRPFTVSELRATQVQLIDDEDCLKRLSDTGETITARMLCAWTSGKDACINDSGGPLIQNGTLIGIVSWGLECASERHPGIYSKVPEFTEWAKKIIKEKF